MFIFSIFLHNSKIIRVNYASRFDFFVKKKKVLALLGEIKDQKIISLCLSSMINVIAVKCRPFEETVNIFCVAKVPREVGRIIIKIWEGKIIEIKMKIVIGKMMIPERCACLMEFRWEGLLAVPRPSTWKVNWLKISS